MVFDCPPLSVGADASIIADRVDGVVLVVDLLSSTEHTVRQAIQQLEAVSAPLLGIVINRDRTTSPSSYDYYQAPPSPGERHRARGKRSKTLPTASA